MTATVARPSTRVPDVCERRRGRIARFRGRWRVALRYGARDARRATGRTALVAVMVMLPVAVGTFAATTLWSTRSTPERVVATELGPLLQASVQYGGCAPIVQTPDDRSGGAACQEGKANLAAVQDAISHALPSADTLTLGLTAQVEVRGHALQRSVTGMQTDLTVPDVAAAFPLRAGRLPRAGEVALDGAMAGDLGVHLGDRVAVRLSAASADAGNAPASAVVVGLLAPNAPADTYALLPAAGPLQTPATFDVTDFWSAQPRWLVSGNSPVTWDDVLAVNKVGGVVLSRSVTLDPPSADSAPPRRGPSTNGLSQLVSTWSAFAAVVIVGLLEAVLLVGPAFAVGARRSARSLALVVAAGGSTRTVRAIVLGTGVVIGAFASVAGVALGLAVAAVVVTRTQGGLRFLSVPWLAVVAVAVVGVVLAAAAAWLPARGASKADVVAVLSGRRGDTAHRRWPAVLGSVLAATGFGGAIVAGLTAQPLLIAAGAVMGEVGLVLACGGIVVLLGRAAARLPLTWRFAFRDAARHRSRTSPAIAAVIVACAGATAGMVYSDAQSLHDLRYIMPLAAPDVLVLSTTADTGLTSAQIAAAGDAVRAVVPAAGPLQPVHVLRFASDDVGVQVDPALGLSTWAVTGTPVRGPVVDDGSLVDMLGIPDPGAARDALRSGRAVVQTGAARHGHVPLVVTHMDPATGTATADAPVTVPAVGVGDPAGPSNANLPVLPSAVAATLGGQVVVGGLVAHVPHTVGIAAQETLRATLADRVGTTDAGSGIVDVAFQDVAHHYGTPQWLVTLLILGSAVLLALAAAWIAAALAAAETRPDLATLTSVGATPSTRKRIVAAQAGTIATIGAVVGSVSGVALGAAFVLPHRIAGTAVDPTWTVAIPWAALGATLLVVPLLAVTASWLATRSGLVLTRRATG